jgi:hypothetical protein
MEGEQMSDFELFRTKEEALAFVKGFETAVSLIDDDHAIYQEPTMELTGEWRVDYGYHG